VIDKDSERFVKALALISLLPGMADLNEEQVELYFRLLKDLPIEDVERAILEVARRKRITTFPLPGEIREKVELSINEELDGAALTAWSKASYLSSTSTYPSSDKLLEDTIELAFGSWRQFGGLDTFHEARDRAHFVKCYKILVSKVLKKSAYPELDIGKKDPGLIDKNKEN